MQPKYLDLPEMKMVGVGTKFISIMSAEKNYTNPIPALWDQFGGQLKRIGHQTGDRLFGLVEMLPKTETKSRPDEMFYIACTEVTDFDAVPPGMNQRSLIAGKYASFTHKGKLDRLGETMKAIYGAWLPSSGVQLREGPHLEIYDHRFVPGSDKSAFDILLPVSGAGAG